MGGKVLYVFAFNKLRDSRIIFTGPLFFLTCLAVDGEFIMMAWIGYSLIVTSWFYILLTLLKRFRGLPSISEMHQIVTAHYLVFQNC